jgi:hypothetical protein
MHQLSAVAEQVDIRDIAEDFRERTLKYVDGGLAKLVLLSSCRDYNSGLYRHDGLAVEYSELAVHAALSLLHMEVFEEMSVAPLEQWVSELRQYLESADAASLRVWKELRPYHLIVPLEASTVAVELVMSNLALALEALDEERRPA